MDRQARSVARPALRGNGDLLARRRDIVRSGSSRLASTSAIRAGGHHLAAAHAGTGAEIDEVVGGPHGVLVVLDDDDGIAHVAQPFQAAQQALVVARMQADARLVENVEDADQAAADLAGQADALGLAAGQRRGASGRA